MTSHELHYGIVVMEPILQLDVFLHNNIKDKIHCKILISCHTGFRFKIVKVTFPVHKLITKNSQITTLYTNWLLYITFTLIYYIGQE